MRILKWKRKEYESWDEAFRGLAPVIRQQSVRVAAYTQVLFVEACKQHFGTNTKLGEMRMRGQYADLAYKCGMYHQLGKALVPPEYQIYQSDFTEEELAVYRKYTVDGRILMAALQEKGARLKEKRKGKLSEHPTNNIPWLMLRESCEQHMERWDGSGYPAKRLGSDISPIAQIVGLAKELDRIASETKSETPFDIAYDTLVAGSGTLWAPELIAVLKAAKDECKGVYDKYISYTRTLPKTVSLVDKRPDRVMGLKYRPMVTNAEGFVAMYEATPWFGGIADQPGETEGIDDLRDVFKRTGLVEDISWYFLYEAADALVRMNNCNLETEGIILNMIPEFYQLGTQLQKFIQLYNDQLIAKTKLILTLPEETYKEMSKANREVLQRYLRHGVAIVLDGYHPGDIPSEDLLRAGITRVRIAPELYLTQECANAIGKLCGQGFTVYAKDANSPDTFSWLVASGVFASSGTMTGIPVEEDEMILDSLGRENL